MTTRRLNARGTGVALAPSIAHLFSAATLLLAGAIAGFFYAYSSSVMPGLDATQPNHAIAAMQAINSKVKNTVFFMAFFGMPVAAFVAAALLFSVRQRIAATLFLLAGVTYLVGAFLPTVLVNVPMNEALAVAGVPADPKEAAKLWADYTTRWTWWNTLRTLFSGTSLLLVGLAIFMSGRTRPSFDTDFTL